MSNSTISTEQAQYTIGVIIDALKSAYVPLFEKKQELESLEKTEELRDTLVIINLRLDILLKIQKYLLEPIQNEYSFIEKSTDSIQPGDLVKIIDHRNSKFLKAIMQGLLE